MSGADSDTSRSPRIELFVLRRGKLRVNYDGQRLGRDTVGLEDLTQQALVAARID